MSIEERTVDRDEHARTRSLAMSESGDSTHHVVRVFVRATLWAASARDREICALATASSARFQRVDLSDTLCVFEG